MRTAFERAIEISYYAGKLWDVATNPDIAEGRNPQVADKGWIPKYGEISKNQIILPSEVPPIIKTLFTAISDEFNHRSSGKEFDKLTQDSLIKSLTTLRKISNREDPAPGYVTKFSNMQEALRSDLPAIEEMAVKMGLAGQPVPQV